MKGLSFHKLLWGMLKGMEVAILGFGAQGKSAWKYWSASGHKITICDQNEQLSLPDGVKAQLGKNYLAGLDEFDLIVRSPSIHPKDITDANSAAVADKITTVTNEFFKICPTQNIIGVTGTKGKGTTSTLIAKMLEAAGKHVHLGGNIGTPPLDLLENNIQPEDYIVLELANFQLIDLHYSPHIAVCLMIEPEHLDWHIGMKEYIAAKQQLFAHQKTDDIAIYYACNQKSQKIAAASHGIRLPYCESPGAIVHGEVIEIDGQPICYVHDVKLLGKHNLQNICAAITAVWQVAPSDEAIRSVVSTFGGLEHRLELVRELDGVKYYDDSFGTTPETAIVAMEAFDEPKIIILGGSDKGASFDKMAKTVSSNNVKTAILIGELAPAIEQSLRAGGFNNIKTGLTKMTEIVDAARQAAQSGDVVLLSTGCASFDLFQNYKDRGEQFKQAVQALV